MHSGALKGAQTQTRTHHQTNRVYLNSPFDAFSPSTVTTPSTLWPQRQNCSFRWFGWSHMLWLSTKIHKDPYRCCFTDKSMNAPHPWDSKLLYSAEHLRWVLQIKPLFLMSQIVSWALLAQLKAQMCKNQDSIQYCSRTNWLRYSSPHIMMVYILHCRVTLQAQ